jgi:RNA polymerase sigma factor (sigma-70 family)
METAQMEDTKLTAMNDAQLLHSYLTNRSEAAFRVLIDRNLGMVYSSCRRQLRNRHLAEDATQVVFVLLSQRAGAIRHSNLTGWLLKTAHYTCNKIRKIELRRHRRETAVAMKKASASESQCDELLAILDDGLSRLKALDRDAIALRYFKGQSLRQVGGSLGISEEAARKRIARCIEKLRRYFARNGIVTGAGVLPAILHEQARTTILPYEAREAITRGILQACHGAVGAAPALAGLAKQIDITIRLARLKTAIAVSLMAVALLTAGWWREMRVSGAGASAIPTERPSLAPVDDGSRIDLQSDDSKYQACRQVLESIIDAHGRNDAGAINSLLYFSTSADPMMVRLTPKLVDVDLAIFRLQRAAMVRFGTREMELNFNWDSSVVTLRDLLSHVDRKDSQVLGDTVVFDPSAPLSPRHGIWPNAPFYFHKADGVWKLDVARTLQYQFEFRRRVPIPGETYEQTIASAEAAYLDSLNAISDDTERGKLENVGELQQRLNGAIAGIATKFSEFTIETIPR